MPNGITKVLKLEKIDGQVCIFFKDPSVQGAPEGGTFKNTGVPECKGEENNVLSLVKKGVGREFGLYLLACANCKYKPDLANKEQAVYCKAYAPINRS